MLGEAVMRTIKEKVGLEEWEKLSEDERDAKYKVRRSKCHSNTVTTP